MYARSPLVLSRASLALVVALHGAAFWGLLQTGLISLQAPLAVLSVSLLPSMPEARPQPEIVPPRPRPVERQPAPQIQHSQIAVAADAPSPTPILAAPAPTQVPAPAAVAPTPVVAPTQPRFDADYLDNPKPVYPAISRRLSEQGRVTLRVHVAADGSAAEVTLQASSGSPRLDQSALDTVRRWKFIPAKLGKEPVAAWVLVPIAFSLKD